MWIAGFSLFLLGPMFVISSLLGRKKNNRCSAQTEGMLKDIRQLLQNCLSALYVLLLKTV